MGLRCFIAGARPIHSNAAHNKLEKTLTNAPEAVDLESQPGERTPPVNSEVSITGYWVNVGPGKIDPAKEISYTTVYIYDARGDQFVTEMQIWKDSAFPNLPDALQFANGQIRCFAHESQLASLLAVLGSGTPLWLRTRDGRVLIVGSRQSVPLP
jgi:hypothetical protein